MVRGPLRPSWVRSCPHHTHSKTPGKFLYLSLSFLIFKIEGWEFFGSDVVRTPDTFTAKGLDSIPGRGTRIPHVTWHGLTIIIIIKWEDSGTPACLREAQHTQLMGQGHSLTGML